MYTTLGQRESGTARLEEAVAAYRAALRERRRERVPLDWAITQNNLGTALLALGVRARSSELVGEAKQAVQLAWEYFRSEGNSTHDAYFADKVAKIDTELAKLGPTTGSGK